MIINISWSDLKNFATSRQVSMHYIVANGVYNLIAIDGPLEMTAQISMDGSDADNQADFENNYKANSNIPILPTLTNVTTQYEKQDKVLKLAKGYAAVDATTHAATVYVKVPGTFGSGEGRYMIGGYGIAADYNPDDYATCSIEDKDRIFAFLMARGADPNATVPLSDDTIKGMGVLPGVGKAFPNYPVLQSFTDDDQSSDSRGWYFWPLSTGTGTPVGEVEINPLGGYGFAPAALYLKIVYQRPSDITTGSIRVNIDWGKREE